LCHEQVIEQELAAALADTLSRAPCLRPAGPAFDRLDEADTVDGGAEDSQATVQVDTRPRQLQSARWRLPVEGPASPPPTFRRRRLADHKNAALVAYLVRRLANSVPSAGRVATAGPLPAAVDFHGECFQL
jgi:hypothetical protein